MNTISQDEVRQVVAYCLDRHPNDVRSILQMNGVQAQNLSKKDLTLATLKAIKDSPQFRQDFSDYVQGRVMDANGNLNAVDGPYDLSQINLPSTIDVSTIDTTPIINAPTKIPTTSNIQVNPDALSTTSSSSSSSGGFFSTLGDIFSGSSLSKLMNTGLNTLSTSLQAHANNASEQTALQIEQTKLAQIQAQNSGSGLSTGVIIALVVVGLGIAGTVIYLATRKK